ncbi:glycosyltransferase family 2 protein [Aliagarivorans marinus]|uniref:glycosyltransferase family 2 protein n=1 Tax=Aliagarivorans marinus TaxID=561965 RepID=UPI0003FB15D7|nr:glycosyltransferase family 2 protein [Aliagarivorans marinus]
MKYSVIIPHFKDLAGLNRLLSSIPTVPDIECIVVDDHSCSRQELADIAQQHAALTLHIEQLPSNSGAGSARNMGLQIATGEWLIFADSDDQFLAGAFDTIRQKTARVGGSELLFFSPDSLNAETGRQGHRHRIYTNMVEQYLRHSNQRIRYCFHVPWSKVFRRTLIDRHSISFDETKVSNDVMFSLKTGYHAKQIAVFEDKIYSVTERTGSLTKTISPENARQRFKVTCDFNCFLSKIGKRSFQIPLTRALSLYGEPLGSEFKLEVIRCYLRNGWKLTRFPGFLSVIMKLKKIFSLK